MGTLLLTACTGAQTSDAQRLVDALRLPSDQMPAACVEIGDADTRAECLAQAAAALAPGDLPAAVEACRAAPEGMWRDECWFLLSDKASLMGEPARTWCAEAGRYKERCRQHAMLREMHSVERPTAVGEEATLRAQTAALVDLYHSDETEEKREIMTNAALAQQLSRRWAEAPFREEDCGTESRRVCAMAFEAHVWSALERHGMDELCQDGLPPSLDALQALGELGWEGESDIPGQVWTRTCRSKKAGKQGERRSGAGVGPRR